jgi:hypothetical protein
VICWGGGNPFLAVRAESPHDCMDPVSRGLGNVGNKHSDLMGHASHGPRLLDDESKLRNVFGMG